MVAGLEEKEKERECTESEKHDFFTNEFAAFFELLFVCLVLCVLKPAFEKFDQNMNKNTTKAWQG